MRVGTEAKAVGSVPLERMAPQPPPAPWAQPASGEAAGAEGSVAPEARAAAAGRWGTDKLLALLYPQPQAHPCLSVETSEPDLQTQRVGTAR